MKKLNILFILLAFAWGTPPGFSQSDCLTPTPQEDYLHTMEQTFGFLQSGFGDLNVKIFARIINEDDGTGGVTPAQLQTELDRLEAWYAPHDICFVMLGYDYINDSDYASPDSFVSSTANNLISDYPPYDDMVNIYIIPNYTFFRGTAYDIPNHYLTISSCRFNTCHLAHEMGHCLGLYHTHETAFGAELVDGSNCGSAGDKLCDTPADPLLGGGNVASCVYTGTATDANGDPYNPDVTNCMSYSPYPCRGLFTAGQEGRMKSVVPVFDLFTQQILLSDMDLVVCCDDVSSGTATEASLTYLRSYDYIVRDNANIQFIALEEVLLENEFTARPNANGQFLARINYFCDGNFPVVFPSPNQNCPSSIAAARNNTADADRFTSTVTQLFLQPNPTDGFTIAYVQLPADTEVQLAIFDTKGRQVATPVMNQIMEAGRQEIKFDLAELPTAIYYCILKTDGQQIVRKLIKI